MRIPDCYGLHRNGSRPGRLEQPGVKRSQRAAVGRGALGEDRHVLAGAQHRGHPRRGYFGALSALEKQRTDPGREAANERPAGDVGLGHEHGIGVRQQAGDIEPRHMVGDQQCRRRLRDAVRAHLDADDAQQAPHPPAYPLLPLPAFTAGTGGGQWRQPAEADQRAERQVAGKPQAAACAPKCDE